MIQRLREESLATQIYSTQSDIRYLPSDRRAAAQVRPTDEPENYRRSNVRSTGLFAYSGSP